MIALAAAAAAHPVGQGISTETAVLRLHPDHLVVEYVAEVDAALLVRRDGPRDPAEDLAVELQTGLGLQLDDARVVLPPVDAVVDRGRSDHTVRLSATFEVPVPSGATRVAWWTTNLQGERAVRAADVWVHPSLRVVSSSLVARRADGRVLRDDGNRWSSDEDRRRVELVVRREPAAWTWLARRGDALVRAPQALDPVGLDRWSPAAREPLAAVGALGVALASRLAAEPPAVHRAAAVALGVVAGALLPVTGVAEVGAGVVLAVAAASPWRATLLPVAWVAWAASLHPWPVAAVAACLALTPLPRATERRDGLAYAPVVAWLALRALAAGFAP